VSEANDLPENAQSETTADDGFENHGDKNREGKDRSTYGSAQRRALRNRRPKEPSQPISLPPWFLEKNVILASNLPQPAALVGMTQELKIEATQSTQASDEDTKELLAPFQTDGIKILDNEDKFNPRYSVNSAIMDEVYATMKTSLSLPTKYADEPPARKTHLLLDCPKEGSTYFLEAVVKAAVSGLDAGVLKLDAQDIAELCGDYQAENPKPSPEFENHNKSMRTLAYDVYQSSGKGLKEAEEEVEEEEEEEESEEDQGTPQSRNFPSFATTKIGPIALRRIRNFFDPSNKANVGIFDSDTGQISPAWAPGQIGISSLETETERWTPLVHRLLSAVGDQTRLQEAQNPKSDESSEVTSQDSIEPRLVVLIPDYKEIESTPRGQVFLEALHEAVKTRRRSGQSVVIVGTFSSHSQGDIPTLTRSGIKAVHLNGEEYRARLIVVTPSIDDEGSSSDIFNEDHRRRIRDINLRHMKDMVRLRSSETSGPEINTLLQQEDWDLKSSTIYASDLESFVWPFDRVHRIATIAVGLPRTGMPLTTAHITHALNLLDASDEAKYEWAESAREEQRFSKEESGTTSKPPEDRLKAIRSKCNTHEKKLLNGVIDATSIRTKFNDVHTPAETIEALKTLTSLPLLRPDAFTYGVLATDKIPGLLLYGPPGTGKTLLAKAVAKESGATMLEVSGSDVYDMFVGEGEKNVRAIFTLAKKLTPCVVFIDEADAIFGSRTGHSNRTTHRELINQFLREWDGMNEMSAFIMVATNRPFDLDDAVLRRLPRRLLVDLPTEKDREAILKIHLRDESLDPTVDLAGLAKRTPLYSGSDLKNLCVAAALACVREEVETAASSSSSTSEPLPTPDHIPTSIPDVTLTRRVLKPTHFEKATEEISASISEDMSSLSAIKKFDEKYGDRRGRRKKMGGWGFAVGKEGEDGREETGRVRKEVTVN
jgi:SpoVK/Ycf46/Vps4 family AAA+-type ATPase